ncbi:MAG: glycine--tRNA ligase subunit beta, partial [Chloroflexota bacterium]|nr:glycine--tRNA ligase subunit beta [Chloroflexota bacterium]
VLGPEPWNVAYVEPSFRPDDGRYGDNPNRMQRHTQFQVILKPDPGDPQERYLRSLAALGIRREEHDIRFVEDNWTSPALGAWGLGWEVWLDGMEITQFTYFQQAGGIELATPAVEITYGLERLAIYLQGVDSVWDLQWDAHHTYGEILLAQEIDYCRYDFEYADIDRLQQMYDLFEAEALRCLELGLAIPALDYILRCSHNFNLLDSRGAVGVTERASFFKRMRNLTRRAAKAYLAQRETAGYPWQGRPGLAGKPPTGATVLHLPMPEPTTTSAPAHATTSAPLLFEIGVEELPATDLSSALEQLRTLVPETLAAARLAHGAIHIWGTPRRLTVAVDNLSLRQTDEEKVVKGPPARIAFRDGQPTRAATGFARSQGVDVAALRVEERNGGAYVVATRHTEGRPASEVLAGLLPSWITGLHFPRSMRWNETGVTFSRPVRWLVALLDKEVVPCRYAGLESDRVTRGPRPSGSPEIALGSAADYRETLKSYGVLVAPELRREVIRFQAETLAASVHGQIPADPALLNEVHNLVEVPLALLGSFNEEHLKLPPEALIAVMKKHQRYFPVLDAEGKLLPYFIAVRNGGREQLDLVRQGNEHVIQARYADAAYFYAQDSQQPLAEFVPQLHQLTFQEKLGSMWDKTNRLEALAQWMGVRLGLSTVELEILQRAAQLAKADLATSMVVEMTSLQGVMGREYALLSGEPPAVAQALYEHYLPRSADDALPTSLPGTILALADRLDSLAGLFAVGLAPTGSSDPYGLRRAASGCIQILLDKRLSFSLRAGLQEAARALPVEVTPETLEAALKFVAGRLQVMLREAGFAHDVVAAALAARGADPVRARAAAQQLSAWVAREDWTELLDNYARCARITRDQPQLTLDTIQLQAPASRELYQALLRSEKEISPASEVDELLTHFTPLIPAIQRFFDEVLVMAEEPQLRTARLALLQRIVQLAAGIVDLSEMEGF